MQLVQSNAQGLIEIHGIPIAELSAVTVNAIRVWVDRKGKSHFEYVEMQPTRDPKICTHRGTWVRRGKSTEYTWAHGKVFHLMCGDCGTALA